MGWKRYDDDDWDDDDWDDDDDDDWDDERADRDDIEDLFDDIDEVFDDFMDSGIYDRSFYARIKSLKSRAHRAGFSMSEDYYDDLVDALDDLQEELDDMLDDDWDESWEESWNRIWDLEWDESFWKKEGSHLPLKVSLAEEKGKAGERVVAKILNELSGSEYTVMNDILLQMGNISSQIDHVVISEYGIFVIETKNFVGEVRGTEEANRWIQTINDKSNWFYSPIKQNERHCQAIAKCLEISDPGIFIPIVVFSKKTSLNVETSTPVIYPDSLIEHISSYKDKRVSSNIKFEVSMKLRCYNNTSFIARQKHIEKVKKIRRRFNQ
ncbi:MAG: NERD domain-containing protein [Lachnospiraceae bacterium]|nr:NERD domain-containing protein [Lachnospiraceae bacterium]